jgi:seryl-tRNA synthetase
MSINKQKFELLKSKLNKIGIPQMDFEQFIDAINEKNDNRLNDLESKINVNQSRQIQPQKDNKDILKSFHEENSKLKQELNILKQTVDAIKNDLQLITHTQNINKNDIENIKLDINNKIITLKQELQKETKTRSITPISRPLNLTKKAVSMKK